MMCWPSEPEPRDPLRFRIREILVATGVLFVGLWIWRRR